MRVSAERYPQRYPLFLRMSANRHGQGRKEAPDLPGLRGHLKEGGELLRTAIMLIDHQQHFKDNPLISLRFQDLTFNRHPHMYPLFYTLG